ncbi:MAG: hypothetical protein JO002_03245 [Burkholderiaceae bacterium]|nr:hypothetical protein [Burkholderiaceae bacterium]
MLNLDGGGTNGMVAVRQRQAADCGVVLNSKEAVAAYMKAYPAISVFFVTASAFEHLLEAGDLNVVTGCFYYRESRTAVRIEGDIRDDLGTS